MSIYIHPNLNSLDHELVLCLKKSKVVDSSNNIEERDNKCVFAMVNLVDHVKITCEMEKLIKELRKREFFVAILISDDKNPINNDIRNNHWHFFAYTHSKAKVLFGSIAENEEDLVSWLIELENELVNGINNSEGNNPTSEEHDEQLDPTFFRKIICEYILNLD